MVVFVYTDEHTGKRIVGIRIEGLGYACVNVSKSDIESLNIRK